MLLSAIRPICQILSYFQVPVILALAASTKAYRDFPHQSVASEAQIRFAIENKYDDTGPGAKEPQYAYNTYKNLDDALIAYLDDPDTKLPEFERHRAIQKLVQSSPNNQNYGQYMEELQRYYPKTVEEYTGYNKPKPKPKPQIILTKLNLPKKYDVPYGFRGSLKDLKEVTPYRLQRIQPVRGNPLSLTHYSRDPELQNTYDQFNPHPKYAFSYGVNVSIFLL